MIVIDTSAIVAFMDSADRHHEEVSEWVEGEEDDLITTPLIVAEVDHLVGTRGGSAALSSFRADLAAGAYVVEWWPGAIGPTVDVAERYADTGLGLADASLVTLAEHVETVRVATLDERHFRVVTPLAAGDAFVLLPQDR